MNQRKCIELVIFLTTLLGGVATQATSGDSAPEPPNNNSIMIPEEREAGRNDRYISSPQVQRSEPMGVSDSEVRQTIPGNSESLPIETIRFTSNPGEVIRHSSVIESLNGEEKPPDFHQLTRLTSQSAASAAQIASSGTLQPSLISSRQQDAERSIDPQSSYIHPTDQVYAPSLSESNSSPFQPSQPVNRALQHSENANLISTNNQLKFGDVQLPVSYTDVQNLQLKLAPSRDEHAGYSEEMSKLQPSAHPEATQESLNSDSSNQPSFSIFSAIPTDVGGSTISGPQLVENNPAGILSPQFINNITDPVSNINGSLLTKDTPTKTDERQLNDYPDSDKQKSLKPYSTISLSGERSTNNLPVPDSINTQRTTDMSNPIPPISLNETNYTLSTRDPIVALNRSLELSLNISSSENHPQGQEETILPTLMDSTRKLVSEISNSLTPNGDEGNPRSVNTFRPIQDPTQQFFRAPAHPFPLNNFPFRTTGDTTLPSPVDASETLTPIFPSRAFTPNPYPDGQNSPLFNKIDPQHDFHAPITLDTVDSQFPGLKLIGESFSTIPLQFEGALGLWSSLIPILFGGRPMPIFSTNGTVQASEPSLQNVLPNPPGFFITSRNINSLGSSLFPTEMQGQSKDNIDQLKPSTGGEPPTVNMPTITSSGQKAIQLPTVQNTFIPATPTISGSLPPFFSPQNPTNNMTNSDRLYLFPISIQLNVPTSSGFGGKIKFPTLETSSKLPFSLFFRTISPFSPAEIKQDPIRQGIHPSSLTTVPFEQTEPLDFINYLNLYYNPSSRVTPGNLTIPRLLNVAGKAMIELPSQQFDSTLSPQITNNYRNPYYENPYYGNPYNWNPNMVNPQNPSYSGAPDHSQSLNSAFPGSRNFPTRPTGFPDTPLHASRTTFTKDHDNADYPSDFRINGKHIPLLTTAIPVPDNFKEMPITEATNDGKPNYINPYYNPPIQGYPEYDKQEGKPVSGAPDRFQPHNPTMTEPRINPKIPETESPTTPFNSLGISDLTNYGDPNYLNTNNRYPKHGDHGDNGNPEHPSDFITPINIPSSKQTIPSSGTFPKRPITASPSALLDDSGIPRNSEHGSPNHWNPSHVRPNYGNPNYLNSNYGNPNYDDPDYSFNSGKPDRDFPLRSLVTPGSRNNLKRPVTGSPNIPLDTSGIPVSTDRGSPMYSNPYFGSPNYVNQNYLNPIDRNPNYDSPGYLSDSGTPGSFPLRNSIMQGSHNLPKRPLIGSPATPLDVTGIPDNTDKGNSNNGYPSYGVPGNRYPYNGNPQYMSDFRIPENVILSEPTSPSSQIFSMTTISGTPNVPFDTARIVDSKKGNPKYPNPDKAKPNNGDPYYNPSNKNLNIYHPNYLSDSGTSEKFPQGNRIIPESQNIPKKPIPGSPTVSFNSERIDELNYDNPNYLDLNNENPDDENPRYDNPKYTSESTAPTNFPSSKLKNPGTPSFTKKPIIGSPKLPYGIEELPDITDYGVPYHLYSNNRNPLYGNQGYSSAGDRNPNYSNPEYPSDSRSPDSIPLRNHIIPGSRNIPKTPITGLPEILSEAFLHADIPGDQYNGNPYHPNNRNPIYDNPDEANPNFGKSHYPAIPGKSYGFPVPNPTVSGGRIKPQRPITDSSTAPFDSVRIVTNYDDPKYSITKNGNQIYNNPDERSPYNGNLDYPSGSRTSENSPYTKTTSPGSHDLSKMPIPTPLTTPLDTSGLPINADHGNSNYFNPNNENPEHGYPNNINPNSGNPNYDNPEDLSYSGTTDSSPRRNFMIEIPHNIPEIPITGFIPNQVSPNNLNSYARKPNYGKPGDRSPYKGNTDFLPGDRTPANFPSITPSEAESTMPSDTLRMPSTKIPLDSNPSGLIPNNVNPSFGNSKYINPQDRNPSYDYTEYPTHPATFPFHNMDMQSSPSIPKRPITATSTMPLDASRIPDNPGYLNQDKVNPNHRNPSDMIKNGRNPNIFNQKYPSYFETLDGGRNDIMPGSHNLPEKSITGPPSTSLDVPRQPDKTDNGSPNYLNLNNRNPNYGNPNYMNPVDRNPNYDHPEYLEDSGAPGIFPLHNIVGQGYIPEEPITATLTRPLEATRIPGNEDLGNLNYSNPKKLNPNYREPNYINPNNGNPNLDNPKYNNYFEIEGPRRDAIMPGSHNLLEKPIKGSPSMLDASGIPDITDDSSPNHHGNPNYGNPYNLNPVDRNPNYSHPEHATSSGTPGTTPLLNIGMQGSRYIPERPITAAPINATRVPDNRDYDNPKEVNPNYQSSNFINPIDKNTNFGYQKPPSYFETLDPWPNSIMPGSHDLPEKPSKGSPSMPFDVSRIPDITDDGNPNYLNLNHANPNYGNPYNINPVERNPNYGQSEYPTDFGAPPTFPHHNVDIQGSRPERPKTATPTRTSEPERIPDNTDHGNPKNSNPNRANPNYHDPNHVNAIDENPNQRYPSYFDKLDPGRNNIRTGSHNLAEKPIAGSPSMPFDVSIISGIAEHGSNNYSTLNHGNPNYVNPNYINPVYRNQIYGHPEYPTDSGTPGSSRHYNIDMQGFHSIPKRPIIPVINAMQIPDNTNYGNPNYSSLKEIDQSYRNPNYINANYGNPNFENPEYPSYFGRINPQLGNIMPGSRDLQKKPSTKLLGASGIPDNTDHDSPNYLNPNNENGNYGHPNFMNSVDKNPNYYLPKDPNEAGTPGSFPLHNNAIQVSRSTPKIPITVSPAMPLDTRQIPDNTDYGNPNYSNTNQINPNYSNPNYMNPNQVHQNYSQPNYINPNQVKTNYSNPNYINPNDGNPNFGNKYPSYIETINLPTNTIMPGSHDLTKNPIAGSPTKPFDASGIPNKIDNRSPDYLNPNNVNTNYGKPNSMYPIYDMNLPKAEHPSTSGTLDPQQNTIRFGSRSIPKRPTSGSSSIQVDPSGIPANIDAESPIYINSMNGNPNFSNLNYMNPNDESSNYDYSEYPSDSGAPGIIPFRNFLTEGSRNILKRPMTGSSTMPLVFSTTPGNSDHGKPHYLKPGDGSSNYDNPYYINPNDGSLNIDNPLYLFNSRATDQFPNTIRSGSHNLQKKPTIPVDHSGKSVNMDPNNPVYLNPKKGNPNYSNPIYINPNDVNSNYPEYPSNSGTPGSIPFRKFLPQSSRNIHKQPITGSSTMPLGSSTTPDKTDYGKPQFLEPNNGDANYDNPNYTNQNGENPNLNNPDIPSNSGTQDPRQYQKPNSTFFTNPNKGNLIHGNPIYINPKDVNSNYPEYPFDSGTPGSIPFRNFLPQGSRNIPKQPITGSSTMPLGPSKTPDNTDYGKPQFLEPNNGDANYDNPNYTNQNGENPNLNNPDYPSDSGTQDPGQYQKPNSPFFSNPNKENLTYGNPIYINPKHVNSNYPEYASDTGTPGNIPFRNFLPQGSRNIPKQPKTGSSTMLIGSSTTPDNTDNGKSQFLEPSNGVANYDNPNYINKNGGNPNLNNLDYPYNSGTLDPWQYDRPIYLNPNKGNPNYSNPIHINPNYVNSNHSSDSRTPSSIPFRNFLPQGSRNIPKQPITGSSSMPLGSSTTQDNTDHGEPQFLEPNNSVANYDNPNYINKNGGNPNLNNLHYPYKSGTQDPGRYDKPNSPIYLNPKKGNPNNSNPIYINPNDVNSNYPENPSNLGTPGSIPFPNFSPQGSRNIPKPPITGSSTMPLGSSTTPDNTDYSKPQFQEPNNSESNYDNPNFINQNGGNTKLNNPRRYNRLIYPNPNKENPNDSNPIYINPNDVNSNYTEYPSKSTTPGSNAFRNILPQGSPNIPKQPITGSSTIPLGSSTTPDNTDHGKPQFLEPNNGDANYDNPNHTNQNGGNPNLNNPDYPSNSGTQDPRPYEKPNSPFYLNPNKGNLNYGNPIYINPNDVNSIYPEYASDSGTPGSIQFHNFLPQGSHSIPKQPITGSSTMPLGSSTTPDNTDYSKPQFQEPNNSESNYDNPNFINQNGGITKLNNPRRYDRLIYPNPNKENPNDSNLFYINPNDVNSNYTEYPSKSETPGSIEFPNILPQGSRNIPKQPITGSSTIPLGSSTTHDNTDHGKPQFLEPNNGDANYDNPNYTNQNGLNPNLNNPDYPSNSRTQDPRRYEKPNSPFYLNPNKGNLNYGNPIYVNPNDVNSIYPEYASDSGTPGSIPFRNFLPQGSRSNPKQPITGSSTMQLGPSTIPDNTDQGKPKFSEPNNGDANYNNPNYINQNGGNPNLNNPDYPSNSGTQGPRQYEKPNSPIYLNPNKGNLNYGNPIYKNPNYVNSNYPEYDSDSATPGSIPLINVMPQGSRNIPKQTITGSLTMPLGSSTLPDNTDYGKPPFLEPNNGGDPNLNNPDYPSNSGTLDPRQYEKPNSPIYLNPNKGNLNYGNPIYKNPNYVNSNYPEYDSDSATPGSIPLINVMPQGSRNIPKQTITGSLTMPLGSSAIPDNTDYGKPPFLEPNIGGDPNLNNPDYPSNSGTLDPRRYGNPNNKIPNYKDPKYQKLEYPFSIEQLGPVMPGSRTTGALDGTEPLDMKNKYHVSPNHGYSNGSPVKPSASKATFPSPDSSKSQIMGSSNEPTNVTDNKNLTASYPQNADALERPNNFQLKNSTLPGYHNFPVRPVMGSPSGELFDAPRTPDASYIDGDPNYAYTEYPTNYVSPDSFSLQNSPIVSGKYPRVAKAPQQTVIGSSMDPLDATRIRTTIQDPKYKNPNNIPYDGNTESPVDHIPLGKSTFPGIRKYLERPIIRSQTEPFDATGTSIMTNYENPASNSDGDSTDYVRGPSRPISYNYTSNPSRERPGLSVLPLIEINGHQPDVQYIRKQYPLNYKYGTQPVEMGSYEYHQNPSHLNSLPIGQPLSGSRTAYGGNPSVYPESRYQLGYPNQYYYYKLPSSPTTEATQEPNMIGKPNDYNLFLKKLPPGTGQWYVTIPSRTVNDGSPDPTSASFIQSSSRDVKGDPRLVLNLETKESLPSDRASATSTPGVTIQLNLMSSVVPTVSTTSSYSPGQLELIKPSMAGTESNLYIPSQRSFGHFSAPSHPIETTTGKSNTAEQHPEKLFINKDTEESTADSPKSINPAGRPLIGSTTITVIPHYSENLSGPRQSNTYQIGQDPINKESGRSIRYYPAYTRSGQLLLQQSAPDNYGIRNFDGQQPDSHNLTKLDQPPNLPIRSPDQLSNPSNQTANIPPQPIFEESARYELTNYPTRPSDKLTDSSVPSSHLPSEPSSEEKIYYNAPENPTAAHNMTGERSNLPGSIRYYPVNKLSGLTSVERSTTDEVDPINDSKTHAVYINKQYALPNHLIRFNSSTDSTDPSERNSEQVYSNPPDSVATTYYRTGQRVVMPGPIRYYSTNPLSGPISGDLSTPSQYDVGARNYDRTRTVSYITKLLTLPSYPSQQSTQLSGSSDPSFEPSSKEPIDADSPADSSINHYRIIQRLNTTGSSKYFQPNYTLPDQTSGEQSASYIHNGGQPYIIKKQLGPSDSTTKASGITIQRSALEKLSQDSTTDVAAASDSLSTIISSANLIGSPQTQPSRISGYRIMSSPVLGSVTDTTTSSSQYSSYVPINSNPGRSFSYDSIVLPSNSVANQPSTNINPVAQSQIVNGARYVITNPASITHYNTGPSMMVHPLQYITRPITTQVKYSVVPAAYRRISGTQNGQFVTSQTLPDMKPLILANLPRGIKVGTRGRYSYTGPDGRTVITNWYVDETGFHIEGEQNTKPKPEGLKAS